MNARNSSASLNCFSYPKSFWNNSNVATELFDVVGSLHTSTVIHDVSYLLAKSYVRSSLLEYHYDKIIE